MGIDIEQTRHYYETIKMENLCDCNYCKNYYGRVKATYPLMADYLNTMGVDIEKPYETSPLEVDENGNLEYCCCQYIVFGDCDVAWQYEIGGVEFRIATSYPNTGIQQKHFVIELFPIKLKYAQAKGDQP